ncbi:MAG TPA: hypothetical protein VJ698_15965 [Noviherbaspirillum sp.]|uniref:hypothetical protein n=1 Tax=Noviherbaspirillum sp. TaxID=1926288 RepID=UPI002B48C480|nr:hypothetical protein [Noviherbaspirillum sp.]HJV86963.1 hypothetical protein [Noviherbaspirillum sp.]
MSSFFCERTAEYALVPLLQRSLEAHFGSAVPIFFWKTREGNRTSSEIHQDRSVQVLAMFARRPKVTGNRNRIAGKINIELIQFAHAARSVGISTIAAFPAVDSIYSLYSDPQIFWLPVELSCDCDFNFEADISKRVPTLTDENGIKVRTMSLKQVSEGVEDGAKILSWDEAMQHISQLRLEHYRDDSNFRLSWFSGYKPVYFLIPRDN